MVGAIPGSCLLKMEEAMGRGGHGWEPCLAPLPRERGRSRAGEALLSLETAVGDIGLEQPNQEAEPQNRTG